MAISLQEVTDDAALVRAVQAGDLEAFSELFRRHHQSVRRACARRMGNIHEADEIAQAAFVRAFERIDRCGGDRRFGPWVQVIAQRLCIDTQRASSRTTPRAEPVRAERAVAPNAPEDELLRAERRADVREALDSLSERQRQVVIDRDINERRPTEIAAALGVSVGAVDSLLMRARRRLAAAYNTAAGDLGGASVASTASAVMVGGTAAVARDSVVQFVGRVAGVVTRTVERAASHVAMLPSAPGAGRSAAAAAAIAVSAFVPSAASPARPAVVPAVALPAVESAPDTLADVTVPTSVGAAVASLPAVSKLESPVATTAQVLPTADAPAAVPVIENTVEATATVVTQTVAGAVATVKGLIGSLGAQRR